MALDDSFNCRLSETPLDGGVIVPAMRYRKYYVAELPVLGLARSTPLGKGSLNVPVDARRHIDLGGLVDNP